MKSHLEKLHDEIVIESRKIKNKSKSNLKKDKRVKDSKTSALVELENLDREILKWEGVVKGLKAIRRERNRYLKSLNRK